MNTAMSHSLKRTTVSSTAAPRGRSIRASVPTTASASNQSRSQPKAHETLSTDSQVESGRRSLIFGGASALFLSAVSVALPLPSSALEVSIAPSSSVTSSPGSTSSALSKYTDSADRFSLEVPSDWQQGEGLLGGNASFSGASGGRRTIAWFPSSGDGNTSLSVVITNVSVEFTKLGSFGSAYQLGTNLVNIQDRSNLLRQPAWLRKKEDIIQIALLVDAKESRDMYQIEYTVRKEEEAQRHLYSILALAPNGRFQRVSISTNHFGFGYNRLYTVTAQCLEQDLPKLKPVLSAMLASFTPPTAVSIS